MKSRILATLIVLSLGIIISCGDDSINNASPYPMGDLSNNGIPFEITDLVIFQNYLVGGLEAVPEGIIPGLSDMNRDGKPFTLADYACFKMIFDGYAKYGQKFPTDPVEVRYEESELLYVSHPVAAIRLVLEGSPHITVLPPNTKLHYDQRDNKTYVLIAAPIGDIGGDFSGLVLYLDHAPILEIEMALPDGAPAKPKGNHPQQFYLEDNYPNPFENNTTIRFDLSTRTEWRLQIFNHLGVQVYGYSGFSEAGVVEIVWDPGDLPYGIYFYRLTVGDESYTKSMLYPGPDY